MMLLAKLQRSTGLIITVLVLTACAILIATRSGANNKDGGRGGIESAAPTQSPTQPASPSATEPKPSSQHVEQKMPARILAFEAAYLIADPAKRLPALKFYVTPQFLALLPKQVGSSPAEKAAIKLSYELDGDSWCDTDLMDATTMYVTCTLGVTSYMDDEAVNAYQVKHETVWVKTGGQWFASAADQAMAGEYYDSP